MNNRNDPSHDPVIVAAVRTAVGKAKKGSLASYRPEEMGAAVVRDLLTRVGSLDPQEIDDLVFGCAFPEGPQGMNIARLIGLRAGLPVSVPAETINRFCSSGLQSIAHAAFSIMAGQTEVAIAGGVESMSMVPMVGFKFAPPPVLAREYPQAFTNMGLTAENVAEQFGISRAEQDAFAFRSHQKAVDAVESGRFDAEIVPLEVKTIKGNGKDIASTSFIFNRDEGPRKDTSVEALGRLKPVFKTGGTVTAGNSSQMSDGAAAVLVTSRAKAEALGAKPMARFVAFSVVGVAPEVMGIGPIEAVPKVLKTTGLSLKDIGLIELNEAFASQSVAVIRELGLDEGITNVNGGAIALGHPLGCTGAKLTTQILYEMKRRKVEFGLVTMCIGGGMGAAGIFQNID